MLRTAQALLLSLTSHLNSVPLLCQIWIVMSNLICLMIQAATPKQATARYQAELSPTQIMINVAIPLLTNVLGQCPSSWRAGLLTLVPPDRRRSCQVHKELTMKLRSGQVTIVSNLTPRKRAYFSILVCQLPSLQLDADNIQICSLLSLSVN